MERARRNPASSVVAAVSIFMRNSSGSAFAATAISSMNDSAGDPGGLTACFLSGTASETLRALHPDDADLFPRHAEKCRDTVAQSVGFHVVRIDGHLTVRRIGCGMSTCESGMSLERHFVF